MIEMVRIFKTPITHIFEWAFNVFFKFEIVIWDVDLADIILISLDPQH